MVVEIFSERPSTFKPELMYQTVKLSTHVGYVEKEFFNKNLSIGNEVYITIQHLTTRFSNRLKKLGIEIELVANYPWIYLRSINGMRVTETFAGEHGFTAFFDGSKGCKFSDRKKVFELIRNYVRHEEQITDIQGEEKL
ncbi:hypothetical protein AXI64_gp025 [Vibrio phage qdvp001]|uniref:hypothetical protein n=1 Tax=Vibrio phage qdvp001 TaxID=1003177 RepID=UPI000722E25F|nr:hypothetical protein AXI64_gp025 [Vibrio phage qdvp001]ALM62017.1 hypothetical protein qdvp001_025 [Vibrio phage qdvp001]